MPNYSVKIRRPCFVTYWGEVEADSPEAAAQVARKQWEDGSIMGFERDSSDLEEFEPIEEIRPDYDVQEAG